MSDYPLLLVLLGLVTLLFAGAALAVITGKIKA
jgi:hypothetical protein